MSTAKIRLYVEHPLAEGQSVPLTQPQAHYLFSVMRLTPGARLLLFNGSDGEFMAEVVTAAKRKGILLCHSQTKPLHLPPDLWLAFAPIKKARTDFIVEKAAEMGAAKILPVQTAHTNADRIRQDRLQAHAVEAAEQCGGTFVPDVTELIRLGNFLDTFPEDRRLMFCDETRAGQVSDLRTAFPQGTPAAILIGPEGGFSDQERDRLHAMPQAHAVSLGPRILRADTAAVAALTLWQQVAGDWATGA